MICPKCKKGEIEPAGTCPVCGYGVVKSSPAAFLPFPATENILSFPASRVKKKIETSAHLRVVKEKPVPSWRLEVSQKVQQVLRARENKKTNTEVSMATALVATANAGESEANCSPLSLPLLRQTTAIVLEPDQARNTSSRTPVGLSSEATESLSGKNPVAPKGCSTTPPVAVRALETLISAPPAEYCSELGGLALKVDPMQQTTRKLQETFDSAMPSSADFQMAYPPDIPLRDPIPFPIPDQQGLLLSRTLSGLIDFITVLFSAVPFFFTLVYLLGYEDIDSFELLVLLGVCSVLFLLYSVFFVTFSGQTIGMMITNLQVVDAKGDLPSYRHAFKRVLAFLLSLATGGLGLAWGIVDRKKRCLHDLMSCTMVVRVESGDLH